MTEEQIRTALTEINKSYLMALDAQAFDLASAIREKMIPLYTALGMEVMKRESAAVDASWETDRLRAEGAYDVGRDGWM